MYLTAVITQNLTFQLAFKSVHLVKEQWLRVEHHGNCILGQLESRRLKYAHLWQKTQSKFGFLRSRCLILSNSHCAL